MNARLNPPETSDLDFTEQLGKSLHLGPGAADEWLGIFLVRYAERHRLARARARARQVQRATGEEISSAGEKSDGRAAA